MTLEELQRILELSREHCVELIAVMLTAYQLATVKIDPKYNGEFEIVIGCPHQGDQFLLDNI